MIGDVIREARKRRNLSRAALAEATGYGRVTIWRLEEGRVKRPSLESLERIASALGIKPETLIEKIRRAA